MHLVLHSHCASPKMADSANVWDLPINFFSHFRSVGVASKSTYKKHFALTIGAHWQAMRPLDPSWQPIAYSKNDKAERRITLKIVLVLRTNASPSIVL